MSACDYCEVDYVEEWDSFHYASGKKICKIHSEGYRQGLLNKEESRITGGKGK